MPVTDALLLLHGTLATPGTLFGTDTNQHATAYVLNFGAAASGASYPYLPEFPSIAEKGYSFPPEIVGDGGVEMGVHLVISTAVIGTSGGMTAGTLFVGTGSTDSVSTTIAQRTLTITQLGVAGAHYFIPVPVASIVQYLGCFQQATTHAADSGTGIIWFGPKTGGEQ
jgi:hypothetical protein